MKNFKVIGAAVALGLTGISATSAIAASYTFDLQGRDSTSYAALTSSFSLTSGDLTAVFDGKSIASASVNSTVLTGGTVNDGRIGRYAGGAGVRNSASDGQHTVDGVAGGSVLDFVQMSFSAGGMAADVVLKSLSFGYIGSDGYRGTNAGYFTLVDTDNSGAIGIGDAYKGSYAATYADFALMDDMFLTNDVFGILAGSDSSWKLKTVTVEYTAPPPAVPLPAGAVLLLTAMGGLGIARSRKKAA